MKTDYEDKYQPWKRIAGLLTAPISGSLSKKVKSEIFGQVDSYYDYHGLWVNKLDAKSNCERVADGISVFGNFVLGPFVATYFQETFPDNKEYQIIAGSYAIYKMIEFGYRSYKLAAENSANTCPGSLAGTLISKAFIEPFLKKEKK